LLSSLFCEKKTRKRRSNADSRPGGLWKILAQGLLMNLDPEKGGIVQSVGSRTEKNARAHAEEKTDYCPVVCGKCIWCDDRVRQD